MCDDLLPTRRMASDSKVDMTLDRMVKAGQHDGVHYSMGYAGHGVQMATYLGRQMAEYMSGVPEANIWRDFEFRDQVAHESPR